MIAKGVARRGAKRGFSLRSLQDLVGKIHDDPALLEKDWRKIVKVHFRLSPDQESSLVNTHSEKVKKIQRFLAKAAHHVRQGGTIKAKRVRRPAKKRTKRSVYDVAIDLVRPKRPRP